MSISNMNKIGSYIYKEYFVELLFDPDTFKFRGIYSYIEGELWNTPKEALDEIKLEIDSLTEGEKSSYSSFKKIRTSNTFDNLEKDMWSLDYAFARYMLPRILYFKIFYLDRVPGDFYDIDPVTGDFTNEYKDEWEHIIDSIIKALGLILDDKASYTEHKGTVEYGLRLFSKYVQYLWT